MAFNRTTLSEYAKVQGGFAYKSKDFIEHSENRVLKINNVRFDTVSYEETAYISDEVAQSTEAWATKEGDVLISMTGSGPNAPQSLVGRVARVWSDEPKAYINQHVGRIQLLEEGKVHPDFLFYLLSLPQSQDFLVSNSSGSANQANISGKIIGLLPCPEVTYEESELIANIVRSLDEKINLNRPTNQTLEQMAQALFKSWFVDFDPVFDNALASGLAVNDFPEALQKKALSRQQQRLQVQQQMANEEPSARKKPSAHKQPSADKKAEAKPLPQAANASEQWHQLFPSEFEQTEDLLIGVDGWVPKGWKLKTIDELNDINPESWTKKNAPDTVKYVDLANAKNGTVLEAVDYLFSEAPSRARRILNKHDIIIGVVRPANKSFAYVNEHGLTGSTGFAVVRAKKESYRAFSYLSLTNDECITEFARIADGAAYPAIKPDDVAKAICLYSNEDILKTFENIVGDFLSKKAASEQQLKPLALLRDTLLPKLISGELTLPADHNKTKA